MNFHELSKGLTDLFGLLLDMCAAQSGISRIEVGKEKENFLVSLGLLCRGLSLRLGLGLFLLRFLGGSRSFGLGLGLSFLDFILLCRRRGTSLDTILAILVVALSVSCLLEFADRESFLTLAADLGFLFGRHFHKVFNWRGKMK